jgi:hypothetical protein
MQIDESDDMFYCYDCWARLESSTAAATSTAASSSSSSAPEYLSRMPEYASLHATPGVPATPATSTHSSGYMGGGTYAACNGDATPAVPATATEKRKKKVPALPAMPAAAAGVATGIARGAGALFAFFFLFSSFFLLINACLSSAGECIARGIARGTGALQSAVSEASTCMSP